MNVSHRNREKLELRARVVLAAAVGGMLSLGTIARAGTFTWTGTGTNNNWSTAANWGGTAPGDSASDDIHFAGNKRTTPVVDLNTPWIVNSISFDSGAAAFSLSGNQIEFNGLSSSLNINSSNSHSIANDLLLNVGTTFGGSGSGGLTLSGVISGAGPLDVNDTGSGGSFNLTGLNTTTAAVTIDNGTLQLAGAMGSLASATSYTLNGGAFVLDNSGTGNNRNHRLNGSANLTLAGGSFSLIGATTSSTTTTESIGQLGFAGGDSTFSLSAGSGTDTSTITAASFSRAGSATGLIEGTKLGAAAAPYARILITDSSGLTQVGTATSSTGPGTTKNLQIVPYLIGDTGTSTGNTFVTYDTLTGLRPLDTSNEFSSTFVTGNNVLLSTTSSTGTVTINSLVLGRSLTINSGSTLTISSGAVLFTGSRSITDASSGGNLAFGNQEAVFTVPSGTGKVSLLQTGGGSDGSMTGVGGLTKAGAGTLELDSTNSISGATHVNNGTVLIDTIDTLSTGDPLYLSAAGSLDLNGHDQTIAGLSGTGTIGIGTNSSNSKLTAAFGSGTFTFDGILEDTLGNAHGSALSLVKNLGGTLVLTGPNTYSGGTTVNAGVLAANTVAVGKSATGTGPVTVANSGSVHGTLAGIGNVSGSVTVNTGAAISAGDGATTTGTLSLKNYSNTFADNSIYLWKINNASGTPGSAVGWDKLALSGLSVGTGTHGVDVQMTAVGAGGLLSGFDPTQNYQWLIATVPSGGTSLAAKFHLDSAAVSTFITNNPGTKNAFSIASDSTDIYVSYTGAPEPTSLALLGIGAGGVLLRRRRVRTA